MTDDAGARPLRVVLATAPDDALGGVFWRAYRDADGPPLAAVFAVAGKVRPRGPVWQRAATPLLLCGVGGCLRLAAAAARLPRGRDRAAGLHLRREQAWPGTPEVHAVASLNASIEQLRALRPDVLVSVGAPEIFRAAVLEVPRVAAVNVHNGRLPLYRGSFGTFWEMMEGEPAGYVSIHEMVPKVDAGRLLASFPVAMGPSSDFLDVMVEKKRRGGALLAELLRQVEREGRLPAGMLGEGTPADRTGLFPMPAFTDVRAFARRRRARA
ncbi:formyltransferase family protein [Longimicrobium sp.]|uniref:formyltransferase family protein n=1 Tax=Longimicrobium sp. TaxID=2029185 RepID=UPI002CA66212|nr:formyltransferase family protein [Longimicrobium sp.]HSU17105.1 formyltransferase family protein [Longimicrobium sp.]